MGLSLMGAVADINMFTTPTLLTATAIATTNGVFTGVWTDYLMPIVVDIGTVVFQVACICGIYVIMRSDVRGGTNRIKWALVGYVMLKCISIFTALVDVIISQIKIPL